MNEEWKKISKKMLDVSCLPEGALTRYQRDIYYFSEDKSISFEEFQKQWVEDNNRRIDELNRNNPIEYDKKIKIGEKQYITLFKRKGLDLSCYYTDYSQYGGCGNISKAEAMERISDQKIVKEILDL